MLGTVNLQVSEECQRNLSVPLTVDPGTEEMLPVPSAFTTFPHFGDGFLLYVPSARGIHTTSHNAKRT